MQVSNFYENVDSWKLTGHPGYEFEKVDNGKSKVIEISHHENNRLKNGRVSRFYKLTSNPNKNDSTTAYVSRRPFLVNTLSLKNKNNDWAFDAADIPYIESIKRKKPL